MTTNAYESTDSSNAKASATPSVHDPADHAPHDHAPGSGQQEHPQVDVALIPETFNMLDLSIKFQITQQEVTDNFIPIEEVGDDTLLFTVKVEFNPNKVEFVEMFIDITERPRGGGVFKGTSGDFISTLKSTIIRQIVPFNRDDNTFTMEVGHDHDEDNGGWHGGPGPYHAKLSMSPIPPGTPVSPDDLISRTVTVLTANEFTESVEYIFLTDAK